MARRNTGRSPKQKIRDAERRAEALTLRKQGLTYDEIAARMGYANRSAAQQIVTRALEELWQEPAEDVRQLELARLDVDYERLERIIGANLPKATARKPGLLAVRAVVDAVKGRLAIAARRAKYYRDLEAPKVTELTGKNGGPIEVSGLTDEQLLALASGAYPTAGLADGGGGARTAPSLANGVAAGSGADADAAVAAPGASLNGRGTH